MFFSMLVDSCEDTCSADSRSSGSVDMSSPSWRDSQSGFTRHSSSSRSELSTSSLGTWYNSPFSWTHVKNCHPMSAWPNSFLGTWWDCHLPMALYWNSHILWAHDGILIFSQEKTRSLIRRIMYTRFVVLCIWCLYRHCAFTLGRNRQ